MNEVTRQKAKNPIILGKIYRSSTVIPSGLSRFYAAPGNLIATLPPCLNNQGTIFIVQKIDNSVHTVTINTTGADTIDGAASIVLTAPNQMVVIFAAMTASGILAVPMFTVLNAGIASVIDLPQTLTIAGGIITPAPPLGYFAEVLVNGEGMVADNLDTITGGVAWTGKCIILRFNNNGAITIKNGTGNIHTKIDFTLDNIYDRCVLQWDSTNTVWVAWVKGDNG